MESVTGKKPVVITICMGSSCFSRGNNRNLQVIEQYIKDKHLEESVQLVGSRCESECFSGPNIRIDEKLFQNVDAASLIDILQHEILPEK